MPSVSIAASAIGGDGGGTFESEIDKSWNDSFVKQLKREQRIVYNSQRELGGILCIYTIYFTISHESPMRKMFDRAA